MTQPTAFSARLLWVRMSKQVNYQRRDRADHAGGSVAIAGAETAVEAAEGPARMAGRLDLRRDLAVCFSAFAFRSSATP